MPITFTAMTNLLSITRKFFVSKYRKKLGAALPTHRMSPYLTILHTNSSDYLRHQLIKTSLSTFNIRSLFLVQCIINATHFRKFFRLTSPSVYQNGDEGGNPSCKSVLSFKMCYINLDELTHDLPILIIIVIGVWYIPSI